MNVVLLHALIAAGRAAWLPRLTAARVALSCAAALAFIPRWGAVGAAGGVLAAETCCWCCPAAPAARPRSRCRWPRPWAWRWRRRPHGGGGHDAGRGDVASAAAGALVYAATLALAWRRCASRWGACWARERPRERHSPSAAGGRAAPARGPRGRRPRARGGAHGGVRRPLPGAPHPGAAPPHADGRAPRSARAAGRPGRPLGAGAGRGQRGARAPARTRRLGGGAPRAAPRDGAPAAAAPPRAGPDGPLSVRAPGRALGRLRARQRGRRRRRRVPGHAPWPRLDRVPGADGAQPPARRAAHAVPQLHRGRGGAGACPSATCSPPRSSRACARSPGPRPTAAGAGERVGGRAASPTSSRPLRGRRPGRAARRRAALAGAPARPAAPPQILQRLSRWILGARLLRKAAARPGLVLAPRRLKLHTLRPSPAPVGRLARRPRAAGLHDEQERRA